MEINLSEEMIENIVKTAFGYRQHLRRLIEQVEAEEPNTQREEAKKMILLNDLKKSLKASEEVHEVFLEFFQQIESR